MCDLHDKVAKKMRPCLRRQDSILDSKVLDRQSDSDESLPATPTIAPKAFRFCGFVT